jgi:hypothetical protein
MQDAQFSKKDALFHTTTGTEEAFYVKITNGIVLRRAVLEVSKDMIMVLQRYVKFKELRAEKLKLMEELSKEFATIQTLTSKMESILPKVSIKLKEAAAEPAEKKAQKREKGEKEAPQLVKKEKPALEDDEDEIKKLESAILDIEDKLSKMESIV